MPHEPEGVLPVGEDIIVPTDGIKPKRLPPTWLDDLTDYFKSKGYSPNDTAHVLLFYSIWLHLEHGTLDGFMTWVNDLEKEGKLAFEGLKGEGSRVQP